MTDEQKKILRAHRLLEQVIDFRKRLRDEDHVEQPKQVGRPGLTLKDKMNRALGEFLDLAEELGPTAVLPNYHEQGFITDPDETERLLDLMDKKGPGRPPATRISELETGIRRNLARIERIKAGQEAPADGGSGAGRPRMAVEKKILKIEARIKADRELIRQEEETLSPMEKIELELSRLRYSARKPRSELRKRGLIGKLELIIDNYEQASQDKKLDEALLQLAAIELRIRERQEQLERMKGKSS